VTYTVQADGAPQLQSRPVLPRSRASTSGILVWLLALALAGCSLVSSSGEPPIPESALARLVLLPEDLSDVFIRFDEGPLGIADAPLGERADPTRFGRIGGWKARYRRPGSAATRGPLVIESRADLFEDSSGAQREFDAYAGELEAQTGSAADARLRDVEQLGKEAIVWTQGLEKAPNTVRFVTVVWRNRNVTGSIAANGFSDRFVPRDVLAFARAQQQRIAAAALANEPGNE
jgi:hypothetical protein